mgnify:CR=1 FL=1
MPTKQELTRTVIDLLGDRCGYDFDSALLSWWQDNRGVGGMRLTRDGHEHFDLAGLENWKFDVDPGTPARPIQLLMLNQHLTMPYYLQLGKNPCLYFYSSKEASMYALYGNIDRFVTALKNHG